jgi:hypothetical protein
MPASLQAAVEEFWSSAGLDGTAGPLHFEEAPANASPPYTVYEISSRLSQKFESGQLDDTRVKFRVHGARSSDARKRGDLIDAAGAMPDRTFAWGDSVSSKAVLAGRRPSRKRGQSFKGEFVYSDELEYQFWVSR